MLCFVLLLFFGLSCEIEIDCSGFLCSDGQCIQASKFCDGNQDCRDSSDENKAEGNLMNAIGIACRQHFDDFWNWNRKLCILPHNQAYKEHLLCTRTNCSDGFLCSNQRCVLLWDFCDGYDACKDGSDEIRADGNTTNTSGIACRQYFDFSSNSSPKLCILPQSQESKSQQICKIRTNCSDGFLCSNQRCIELRYFCNGYNNCKDGSDEIPADGNTANESGIACRQYFDYPWDDSSPKLCILPQSQESKSQQICKKTDCSDEGFLCDNQKCLHPIYFCDGRVHCKDGSDEIRADRKIANTSGIACRQYFDDSSDSYPKLCILPQSQESKSQQFCRIKTDCSEGFICGNDRCVEPSDVCGRDGKCGNNDDHALSNRGDRLCSSTYSSWTSCSLPQEHICDATSYCEGGVDECLCGNGESQVFLDEKCFRCLRNRLTVIPLGQLCDGIFDCSDLTDECLCNDGEKPLLCDAVQWEEQSVDPLEINCTGNVTTLGMKQICDKKNDCENMIDEENCTRDSNLGTNPSKISDISTFYCPHLRKIEKPCKKCHGAR